MMGFAGHPSAVIISSIGSMVPAFVDVTAVRACLLLDGLSNRTLSVIRLSPDTYQRNISVGSLSIAHQVQAQSGRVVATK
jgi:hypothetical protein